MRKITILLLMLTLLFSSACNDEEIIKEKASSPPKSQNTVKGNEIEKNTNNDKTEVDAIDIMDDEVLGDFGIGMTDENVITELDECHNKGNLEVWGADGLKHQQWDYKDDGISLGMVGEEGNQVVDSIYATSPFRGRTKKGIRIGSTRDEVLKAYKEYINTEDTDDNTIVVGFIYRGIIFEIDEGVVASIFIGAAAE